MAFSSLCLSQNFTRHFTVPEKPTLRYRHQTRTKNPAHQFVACAKVHTNGNTGCRYYAKSLVETPAFEFNFMMYGTENKIAF